LKIASEILRILNFGTFLIISPELQVSVLSMVRKIKILHINKFEKMHHARYNIFHRR
jgi:hypothetical protein